MGEQESGKALGQAVKALGAAELARVSASSFWTEEEAAPDRSPHFYSTAKTA